MMDGARAREERQKGYGLQGVGLQPENLADRLLVLVRKHENTWKAQNSACRQLTFWPDKDAPWPALNHPQPSHCHFNNY
eukprot:1152684-Pelagomonas_calceolata.AAC.3